MAPPPPPPLFILKPLPCTDSSLVLTGLSRMNTGLLLLVQWVPKEKSYSIPRPTSIILVQLPLFSLKGGNLLNINLFSSKYRVTNKQCWINDFCHIYIHWKQLATNKGTCWRYFHTSLYSNAHFQKKSRVRESSVHRTGSCYLINSVLGYWF